MRLKCVVCIVTFAVVLNSCAPISRESCRNESAFDIGYHAAMDNADQNDRGFNITKICRKEGREIDHSEYSAGFEWGTKTFCLPDNGYHWGRKGRVYNGICANPEFSAGYEDGLSMYRAEQRRTTLRDRLVGIRWRLSTIAKLFDEDKTLTEERKRELRREEQRLLLERSDLLAEQRELQPS